MSVNSIIFSNESIRTAKINIVESLFMTLIKSKLHLSEIYSSYVALEDVHLWRNAIATFLQNRTTDFLGNWPLLNFSRGGDFQFFFIDEIEAIFPSRGDFSPNPTPLLRTCHLRVTYLWCLTFKREVIWTGTNTLFINYVTYF